MPGSSVHGILQAKTLQWVAISSSRGSSRPRDRTAWAGRFFTSEPPGRLDGVAVTFGSQAVPRARRLCLDPGGGPHAGGRVDGGGWGPGQPREGGQLHPRGETVPHFCPSSLGASVSPSCPGALAGSLLTPSSRRGEKAPGVRLLVQGEPLAVHRHCADRGGRRADALRQAGEALFFAECFCHEVALCFVKSLFCISWDDQLRFVLYILLMWCLTLIDFFLMLSQFCILGINPT